MSDDRKTLVVGANRDRERMISVRLAYDGRVAEWNTKLAEGMTDAQLRARVFRELSVAYRQIRMVFGRFGE